MVFELPGLSPGRLRHRPFGTYGPGVAESALMDGTIANAVSNIKPRSERQPDVGILERTYVETGVLPQLQNANNQILYGRRGTGKSHVLRVLGVESRSGGNTLCSIPTSACSAVLSSWRTTPVP